MEMKLREPYFSLIKNGRKVYEIRLNDEKRRLLRVGDELIFVRDLTGDAKIFCEVVDLLRFGSFEECFKNLPLEQVGFAVETIDSAVAQMHKFYSNDDEKNWGVLAIKVNLKGEME